MVGIDPVQEEMVGAMTRRFSWVPLAIAAGCKYENPTDIGIPPGQTTDDTGTEPNPVVPGCVKNGDQGFDTLSEALADASDGDAIDMTACKGFMEDNARVEAAVTITGPGSGLLSIDGQADDAPAIYITADGVSLTGTGLTSAEAGLVITGADATVSDITIDAAGDPGVFVSGAGADISGVTVSAGGGGVQVEGVAASLTDVSVTSAVGYGVLGYDGASLTLSGGEIAGVTPNDDDAATGIRVDAASSADISGTTVSGQPYIGVWAQGPLSLDDVTVTGQRIAVAIIDVDATITDSTILDGDQQGVLATGGSKLTMSDTLISGKNVADVDHETWKKSFEGTGLALRVDQAVLTDVTVEGYSAAGIVATPGESGADLDLVRVTLLDNRDLGLYAEEMDIVATDVDVLGLSQSDPGDAPCQSLVPGSGVAVLGGGISWNGGEIADNDGHGLAASGASTDVAGLDVSGNACGGIFSYQGSLTVGTSTFSASGHGELAAGIVIYEGTTSVIEDSDWIDNDGTGVVASTSWKDKGSNFVEEYSRAAGADLQVYSSGATLVRANSFSNGARSLYAYDTDLTVENSTWTAYDDTILWLEDAIATVTNATVDGFTTVVDCDGSMLDVAGLTADNGNLRSTEVALYEDGKLSSTTTLDEALTAVVTRGCALDASGLGVETSVGQALFFEDSDVVLGNAIVTSVGSQAPAFDAVTIRGSTGKHTVSIDGLTVTDAGFGSAVSIEADGKASLTVEATDVTVDGAAGQALELDGVTGTLSTLDLQNAGAGGLVLLDGTYDVSAASCTNNAIMGLRAIDATVTVAGSTFDSNGSGGIFAEDSEVSIQSSSASSNGLTGVTLTSMTGAVDGNTISNNGDYGMSCTDSAPSPCTNTMSGNVSGDLLGCGTCSVD